ncbi:MAG: hypothetical protein M3378_11230 [Actinomycetota bacterium]|nr:hypothetical protein [Actinomycetota bacterium]
MAVRDGALVQGDGQRNQGMADPAEGGRLYRVEDGRRHPIPDVQAFLDAGYDPADVEVIDDEELESIPLAGAPLSLAAGQQIVLDHYSFLRSGHYMRTYGVLRKTSPGGRIDATTRTWTITMFGGFRGGVNIVFSDAEGFPVGMTATQRFGVDGTWIGRSDRTDYWSTSLTEDWATRTTDLTIFHFWDPNTLQTQVGKLVAATKPILEIVRELVAIGVSSATTKK